jgi:hypothetical protein
MHPHQQNTKPEWTRLGYSTAIATVVITTLTFAIAFLTPPLSGPFCTGACFEYPFSRIASRFPRDYYWMYPAMLLSIIFVVLVACIHQKATEQKRVYSHIALLFSLLSAALLLSDYFIQVSVVPVSLLNKETDGIAILTQYNPHGIFIALEELGYLMMSFALFCTLPVFSKKNRLEKAIRTTFLLNFVSSLLALMVISVIYGIRREYRFEVAVITLNWLALIVSGILLSKLFKHQV